MKTSSFRRPRRLLSPGGGIVVGGVVLVSVLLLALRVFLPGTLSALAAPLWSLGTQAAARVALPESADALRVERDALLAENAALRNENLALVAELADTARVARSEGEVVAGVLVRPPVTPYDVLIVSAGSKQGIVAGATAYGPGGIPVGSVTSVSTNQAHVTLYSATGQSHEGWIGEDRMPATIEGEGAGSFRASISTDAQVKEGDAVYLPGPGGLPVGTVARIEVHPASPEATLYVRPLVNPFTLTAVSIDASLP